ARDAGSEPLVAVAAGECGARGVLAAWPAQAGQRPAVAAVLDSAACAAERVLDRRWLSQAESLLDRASFEERVAAEVGRARRYGREVALLVCRPADAAGLRACGRLLSAQVRRWDAV